MSELKKQNSDDLEHRVLQWRDKYVSRIERDMTGQFPRLESNLKETLETNWKLILKSKPKKFAENIIQPEIEDWIEQVIQPINREAEKELQSVAFNHADYLPEGFSASKIQIFAVPIAAILIGIGGVVTALYLSTLTTFFGLVANPAIGIPVAVTIVAASAVILAGGAERVSRFRSRLTNHFAKRFIPKLRECLIGEGYEDEEKEWQPSLKVQFQTSFENAAQEILDQAQK